VCAPVIIEKSLESVENSLLVVETHRAEEADISPQTSIFKQVINGLVKIQPTLFSCHFKNQIYKLPLQLAIKLALDSCSVRIYEM